MAWIKTLIHIHTDYSYDSNITLETLARFADRNGFACLAVTDHDTIEGALRLQSMTQTRIIVGEEITTLDGHLIGLFLQERIRPGMPARDTADAIREQGGLVLAPHPFVKAFGCGLGDTAWEIADRIDAVEVFNAQNPWAGADAQADEFADRLALPKFVGTDTHYAGSIAPAFQVMPDFSDPAGFLASLRSARRTVKRHPLRYFASAAYRTARYLLGLSSPPTFGARYQPAYTAVPGASVVALPQS